MSEANLLQVRSQSEQDPANPMVEMKNCPEIYQNWEMAKNSLEQGRMIWRIRIVPLRWATKWERSLRIWGSVVGPTSWRWSLPLPRSRILLTESIWRKEEIQMQRKADKGGRGETWTSCAEFIGPIVYLWAPQQEKEWPETDDHHSHKKNPRLLRLDRTRSLYSIP